MPVNLDKMTREKADQIANDIGEKIRNLVDKTIVRANRILGRYGLQAKMQIVIEKSDQEDKQSLG